MFEIIKAIEIARGNQQAYYLQVTIILLLGFPTGTKGKVLFQIVWKTIFLQTHIEKLLLCIKVQALNSSEQPLNYNDGQKTWINQDHL